MFLDYWDAFYSQPHDDIAEPSPFAQFVLPQLRPGSSVFELGCGNGRDAIYFARNGVRVIACDQSDVAITSLRDYISRNNHFFAPPELLVARFKDLAPLAGIEAVYSRFTLHAIDEVEASLTMRWAHSTLETGGRLFIEARSVKGDMYGLGKCVGRDAFIYGGHYRRFVRSDELVEELVAIGFALVECVEDRGLAVHENDDPVVIRAIVEKAREPSRV